MNSIEIQPCGPLAAEICPPGSKSITNRALVCAALASGTSRLDGALDSDDTRAMIAGLRDLGIAVVTDREPSLIEVTGCAGQIPVQQARLQLGNSGTSLRFLTAVCALGHGQFYLDGVERMRQRPVGGLVHALNQLGSDISCVNDCPPVTVNAAGLAGGTARVPGGESSQFLSALLMVMPFAQNFTVAQRTGPVVSAPYINMTCQVMRQFGVDVLQMEELGEYSVDPRHHYSGTAFQIEPDATAASYFWAAAAICGGAVRVNGLTPDSLQGDVRFIQLLEDMGCTLLIEDTGITVQGPAHRAIEADMRDISDTVQTLAAVALFVPGTTTIRGVAHNRLKETDRIGHLAVELRKLGAGSRSWTTG